MAIQIGDITPRQQYIATAGQTVYILPFPFYADTDLLVYSRASGSSPNDVNDILTLNVDYTVTGAGLASGGTVTLTAASTVGDIVTVMRDMPEDRSNLYINTGSFTTEAVNADFNRDVMMNQQNELAAKGLSPKYDNNAVIGSGDLILDTLLPGYSWRMNATGTRIEAYLPSGGGGGSGDDTAIKVDISQNSHGLSVGDIVRIDGSGNYVVSQADSASNAEVVGIVSAVSGVDDFTLQMGGVLAGLVGLTAGSIYYLSPSAAGAYTVTKPTTAGQVVKAVFQAASTTTAIWLNYLGILI